jgi:hypothetical protein
MVSLSIVESLRNDAYKDSDDGTLWILFDSFYGYLVKKAKKEDKITLKKINIFRFFENDSSDIKLKDTKPYVRFGSILKFVFQYMSKISVCHEIAREVETFFTGKVQCNTENAIYDLYCDIAKCCFRNDAIKVKLHDSVTVPECIPTLYEIHKPFFTPNEWTNICWFEYHYGKLHGHEPSDLSQEIKQRCEFYETLKATNSIAKNLTELSKTTIQQRAKRRGIANIDNKATVHANMIHLHEEIDEMSRKTLGELYPSIV